MPYPLVGSFTKTWVTAPTNFPFWIIGEPLTSDVNMGQQNMVIFLQTYDKRKLFHQIFSFSSQNHIFKKIRAIVPIPSPNHRQADNFS